MKRTNGRATPLGSNSRKRAALLLVLLALVAVFALWPSRRPPVKRAALPDDAPVPVARASPTPLPPPAATLDVPTAPAPVIDEILVEKPEVCTGEENLITVRAHTENGTDDFLHYTIDGKKGQSVPVRLMTENGQIIGRHDIRVFGRNNVATTVPLPSYRVKDCRPTYLAEIQVNGQPNSWADYDFVAKVAAFPGPPGIPNTAKVSTPVSYDWSFGDGETATTDVPTVSHNYEGRSQDDAYSYLLVTVKVHMEDRSIVSARTDLALENPAFESLKQKGVVQLLISLDPRFPELGEDGRVVQHVRVWHTAHEPVRIDAAAMTKYFVDADGEAAPVNVPLRKLLSTNTIMPGKQGVNATVVLDTNAEPKVFSETYRLAGKSASGIPVAGSFTVMKPPRRPTREHNKPVNDPVLKAKIVAAREMLGKDIVTDLDLTRLERQGRFARLVVAPAEGPPAPPPAPPGPTSAPSGSAAAGGGADGQPSADTPTQESKQP